MFAFGPIDQGGILVPLFEPQPYDKGSQVLNQQVLPRWLFALLCSFLAQSVVFGDLNPWLCQDPNQAEVSPMYRYPVFCGPRETNRPGNGTPNHQGFQTTNQREADRQVPIKGVSAIGQALWLTQCTVPGQENQPKSVPMGHPMYCTHVSQSVGFLDPSCQSDYTCVCGPRDVAVGQNEWDPILG